MTPELARPEGRGKQEILLDSLMQKINSNKDLFCAGKPINYCNAMRDRGDGELVNVREEHMHIIVAPKKPIFDSDGLNFFTDRVIEVDELKRMGGKTSHAISSFHGGMYYPNINFQIKIGTEKTEITTKKSVTPIDEKALARMRIPKESSWSKTTKRNLESLITIHVFPDALSAKIAFAYLSKAVKGQEYGSYLTNLDVRDHENEICGTIIKFLRENQGMDTITAVKATEALMNP